MKKGTIAILAVSLLLGMNFILKHIYNNFVDEAHFLHIARGRVEAELQRRHDVITGCFAAANQYMDIEGLIFSRLVKLNGLIKSHPGSAALKETEQGLSGLMARLDLLVERYPELGTKKPYLYLMEAVQDSGWRVTRERLYLNERVYEYNMMRQIFPNRFFAWLFRFHQEPFFEAAGDARGVPAISRSQTG